MYFYYWVPVKKHIDFKNQNTFLKDKITKKIADINKDLVDITLSINKSTFDIQVDLLIRDSRKTFYLVKKESDQNGFLIYECITIKAEDKQDIELLTIQVYHCFKDFFHIHEYHDAGNDALISAYYSETLEDPSRYLEHYYKLYTDKFNEYKLLIDLCPASYIIKEFKEKTDIAKASFRIAEARRLILLAQGEMLYADFLLSVCLHYHEVDEKIEDLYKEYKAHFEMYEKELNIYNDSYTRIYDQINLAYSKQINLYQLYLGAIGVLIGFFSLI